MHDGSATRPPSSEEASDSLRAVDDPRIEAVVRLGRALHEAGSPTHRVEAGMEAAASGLGLSGQFFATPTALFASFITRRGRRHTVLERVEPAPVNLERMVLLRQLFTRLSDRDRALDPRAVIEEVDELLARPPRYAGWPRIVAHGLVSAAAAVFFRGGATDVAASALVGLLIGVLAATSDGVRPVERLLAPLAAFVAAFVVTAGVALGAPISASVVILSGMIVLIPGLTLTVSFTELATRQLVAGSARLAGALVEFLALAFGVGLGSLLAEAAFGPTVQLDPVSLPAGLRWAAVGLAALGLTILFRASMRDLGWVLLAGALAVESVELGSRLLGPQLGAFAGALAVGLAGNLLARTSGRPAALIHTPGLILLVPGSLGFRSLAQLMEEDVLTGVGTAFDVALIGISLATGLLLSSVVLPPRRVV